MKSSTGLGAIPLERERGSPTVLLPSFTEFPNQPHPLSWGRNKFSRAPARLVNFLLRRVAAILFTEFLIGPLACRGIKTHFSRVPFLFKSIRLVRRSSIEFSLAAINATLQRSLICIDVIRNRSKGTWPWNGDLSYLFFVTKAKLGQN